MAATTMATAAGAVVLYYVLSRRATLAAKGGEDDEDRSSDLLKLKRGSDKRRIIARSPAQAPATWFEAITTLSETLRFTYAETLGKWPIGDLAFGINFLIHRKGDLQVASVYAGENCVELKGHNIVVDLNHYLRLLTLCILFSKKPFPVFLESAGYSQADVLLQKPKAGLLKPAFTILCDKKLKCLLLLIRGTHSVKDTLTAATGAVVPFHHSVLHDGGISNLVLGYAHCGMVAAARWIAKLSTPCLLKALDEYSDYRVEIVGHSLGGGTAALLTYILREQQELSSCTCVTFAPAASMTMEFTESGKHFITTIINGSDLVPTFSAASLDDLRSEVTGSSWLNDLRDQVERTRVLNVIYRLVTALGSHLPSIASAKARVVGAGAILQPVSSSTKVVMKRARDVAQAVRTRSSLSSWSCMGPRRRAVGPSLNSKVEDSSKVSLITERIDSCLSEGVCRESGEDKLEFVFSGGLGRDDTDEEEERMQVDEVITKPSHDNITEGELWYELEKELQRHENNTNVVNAQEAAALVQEITEEEKVLVDAVDSKTPISSSDVSDTYCFYPPGKIMHLVFMPSSNSTDHDSPSGEHIGIYETPRELYSKIRLSRTMINDHYMPMYKKMMELLIRKLENDEGCSSVQ